MNTILFSKACEGFWLSLGARHISPNTIDDYSRTISKFAAFLGDDLPVTDITSRHIETFLASFNNLSNKSLLNYYIGLSSLWTWLTKEELVPVHILRKITPPKAEQKEIIPFTEAEVKAIMSALNRSKIYVRQGRNTDHALGSFERNRAILLLLLDTGIRASELCNLNVEDLDNRNNRVFVHQGKGMKERLLPFSPRTGQMIWRYLASRKDALPRDPLFLSKLNRSMGRTKLSAMFQAIGKHAGFPDVHPHRFRHTFAIQYLRNGGNAYTLQAMLGHSTLETVRIYLKLAQLDIDLVHRRASPVDNWRL